MKFLPFLFLLAAHSLFASQNIIVPSPDGQLMFEWMEDPSSGSIPDFFIS